MDDSAKGRYDMILCRELLTALRLNIKFYDNIIESYDVPFKGFTAPTFDLGTYQFTDS